MDDFVKHAPSYQLDQEILDARGINMTVEEVAGLPTCKYSQRVQSLRLNDDDLAFLKGLRRRIKNRLASQNSRRRSMEHLRRLTRELRAVKACRDDALCERRSLLNTRSELRSSCAVLRAHIIQILKERTDPTPVPELEPEIKFEPAEPKILEMPIKTEPNPKETEFKPYDDVEKNIFQCRIDKLVHQSVNHIYKGFNDKIVTAKTVFIDAKQLNTDYVEEDGVLNLCVKETKRSHGRKQKRPKRITYVFNDNDDGVIDFSIKKENN